MIKELNGGEWAFAKDKYENPFSALSGSTHLTFS